VAPVKLLLDGGSVTGPRAVMQKALSQSWIEAEEAHLPHFFFNFCWLDP